MLCSLQSSFISVTSFQLVHNFAVSRTGVNIFIFIQKWNATLKHQVTYPLSQGHLEAELELKHMSLHTDQWFSNFVCLKIKRIFCLNCSFLFLCSRDSSSIFLVWGPEIYIFIRFPSDSGAGETQFYIVEGKEGQKKKQWKALTIKFLSLALWEKLNWLSSLYHW